MKKLHHQSTKEVELSRKLAVVLENLPFGMILFIIQYFANKINSSDDEYQYEVRTEKTFQSSDRYDVFLPLSYNDKYNEIIIETKLQKIGKQELYQMNRYLKNRGKRKPLVIGIGKIRPHDSNEIVLSTWDEIFKLLFNMIGYDSKARLLQNENLIKEYSDIVVPKLFIGKATEVIIEQFLEDLIQKDLLTIPISNRILVVSGKFASYSCINYNIDLIGNNWDHRFKYLCVVYEKSLRYIGQKVKLYDDIQIANGVIINNADYDMADNEKKVIVKLLVQNANRKNSNEIRGSAVVLKPVDLGDDSNWTKYNLKIGEIYQGKGAITQSHRYFNDIHSFIKEFRKL